VSRHTPRTASYRRLCARVKAEEPICWLCGHPIDPRLSWPDPWSFSLDHVIAASVRPDLAEDRANCRAAHLVHNQQRQTGQNDPKPELGALALTVDEF
jgi:hypothetical protein